MESVSVSETSEDSQICEREQAEQEELCDILSRFYDIIRPEEEKVRMKVFFLEWLCITCITSVYFFLKICFRSEPMWCRANISSHWWLQEAHAQGKQFCWHTVLNRYENWSQMWNSFIKLTSPFLRASIKFVFGNISIRVRNTYSHLSGMNTHTFPFHFMKNKAGVYLEKGNIVIFHPNFLWIKWISFLSWIETGIKS